MADREEIIRIILDGRDRLSSVAQRAAKNIDDSVEKIRSSYTGLDKEQRKIDASMQKSLSTIEKQGKALSKNKKEVDDLTESVRKLNKETEGVRRPPSRILGREFSPESRRSISTFIENVKKGAEIVESQREELNKLLARTTDARKERVRELEEEARKALEISTENEARDRNIERARHTEEIRRINNLKDSYLEAQEQQSSTLYKQLELGKRIVREYTKIQITSIEEVRNKKIADTEDDLKRAKKAIKDELAEKLNALELEKKEQEELFEKRVEIEKRNSEEEILRKKKERREETNADIRDELQTEIAQIRRANTLSNIRLRLKKEELSLGLDPISEIERRMQKEREAAAEQITNAERIARGEISASKKVAEEEKKNVKEVAREREKTLTEREAAELASNKQIVKEKIELEKVAEQKTFLDRLRNIRKTGIAERSEIRNTRNERIRALGREENDAAILAQSRAVISEFLNAGDVIERASKKIGSAWKDMRLGSRDGRAGLRELSKEARAGESGFTRFGFAVGKAAGNVRSFINLRWATIIGLFTVFLTFILRIGAALVSLAASATLAGAALGGALVAGITQAIPVFGLLAAAMQRLNKVFDAVKLAEENRINASTDAEDKAKDIEQANQALADSEWAVKKAIEAVADAQYAVGKAHDDVKEAVKRHSRAIEALSDAQYEARQAGKRVTEAIQENQNAIKRLSEARIKAQQDIVDANLAEQESALSLQEAELALLDAKKRLREEEEKRKRSSFDVEGARAAIREAQDRLALAREQGDQAEISKASQQATLAQQNLNAILDQAAGQEDDLKSLQLAVERSEINLKQAQIRSKRAKEEARDKRTKGVEGSEGVISAKDDIKDTAEAIVQAQRDFTLALRGVRDAREEVQETLKAVSEGQRNVKLAYRGVRDAVHALAIAKREEADSRERAADALKKETAGQEKLREALAELTPSERQVYESAKRLQEVYRKVFAGDKNRDGILGPINEAVARGIDTLVKLLKDPEIQSALKNLSSVIGDGIGQIADLAGSKEFRKDMLFFIRESAKNLPLVVDTLIRLFRVFSNIGKTAAPIFRDLLEGFNGFVKNVEKITDDDKKMNDFFSLAGKHLAAWIDFAEAVGNLFLALVNPAAGEGKTLLEDITDLLNKWAEWIRDNPEKVQKFFKEMRESLGRLAKILGGFIAAFVKALSSKEFEQLTEFILETFIPAMIEALRLIGAVAGIFNRLTEIPILGDFIKIVAQFLILERVFNFLFPFTQFFTSTIKALVKELGKFLLLGTKLKLLPELISKLRYFLVALSSGKIAAGIRLIGAALSRAFIMTPWGAVIVGLIALIVLLDKKFHFLKPTLKFIGDRFKALGENIKKFIKDPIQWIKDNWLNLLKAVLLGPMAPIYFLFKKQIDKIAGYLATGFINGFKKLGEWFANIGKWIYNNIIKPVMDAFGISSPSKVFFDIGMEVVNGFINAIKKIPNLVLGIFKKIPGLILEAIKFGPKFILSLLKKIPGFNAVKDAVKDALGFAGDVADKAKSGVAGAAKGVVGAAKGVVGAVGGIFGGKSEKEKELEHNKKMEETYGKVLKIDEPYHGGLIARLRKRGLNNVEIWAYLTSHGIIKPRRAIQLQQQAGVEGFNSGGIAGRGIREPAASDTVPAMLTPGEWVLNKGQQDKVAKFLGVTVEQLQAMVFGTNVGKTKPKGKEGKLVTYRSGATLVPQTDEYGVEVWFIQLKDGTYGQVTGRDAAKINATDGQWIPEYVKRSAAGFQGKLKVASPFNNFTSAPFNKKYALGGVVQGFAGGGIVQQPGFNQNNKAGNTIHQNFNVTTDGESDWDYIMRRSAITAQGAF